MAERIKLCAHECTVVIAEKEKKKEQLLKEQEAIQRRGGLAIEREKKRLTKAQERITFTVKQQEEYALERERLRLEALEAQKRYVLAQFPNKRKE